MALQKDTENFLLLLSSFNKEQEKVNDIYIEQIKQTDEYKMLENIKDYEFISKTAKDLKSKLQQINIKMQSITQIREEYRKLITLTNDWLKLMDESRKQLNRNQYHLDIISKNDLSNLKKVKPSLYRKIEIIKHSKGENVPLAFRKYIKTGANKEIIDEYLKIRTPQLNALDEKRGKVFLWGGGLVGAIIFTTLMSYLIPVPSKVELAVSILSLVLLLFGFFKRDSSKLRIYTQLLLAVYIVFFILVSITQEFGYLPKSFDAMAFRSLNLKIQSAILGILIGMTIGERINFIPVKNSINLPSVFQFIERQRVFLIIACGIFGFIWTTSFLQGVSVYDNVSTTIVGNVDKLMDKLIDKFNDEEKVNVEEDNQTQTVSSEIKAIGNVQVIYEFANLRTQPNLENDETIYTQVKKGDEMEYFDTTDVNGTTWYQVQFDNNDLWISGKTVKVVE